MQAILTPEITAPSREERLAPSAETSQPRKRRFRAITFGLAVTLGLGVAGGANLHRLVDMGQTTTWLQQAASSLQSGLDAASTKIGTFTARPVSVAQASQDQR